MLDYIKQNKILLSVIVLLLVAGIYVGILACQQHEQPVTNQTPVQQVNIEGSEGFSVNGDVTNTEVVTTITGDNNKEVVEVGPNITGTSV